MGNLPNLLTHAVVGPVTVWLQSHYMPPPHTHTHTRAACLPPSSPTEFIKAVQLKTHTAVPESALATVVVVPPNYPVDSGRLASARRVPAGYAPSTF